MHAYASLYAGAASLALICAVHACNTAPRPGHWLRGEVLFSFLLCLFIGAVVVAASSAVMAAAAVFSVVPERGAPTSGLITLVDFGLLAATLAALVFAIGSALRREAATRTPEGLAPVTPPSPRSPRAPNAPRPAGAGAASQPAKKVA